MSIDLPVEGPSAPPRLNGEIVFQRPWESRVFGITAALAEAGAIDWNMFQQELIVAVGEQDGLRARQGLAVADKPDVGGHDPSEYWTAWLAALSALGERVGLVEAGEFSILSEELASRPAGHDH